MLVSTTGVTCTSCTVIFHLIGKTVFLNLAPCPAVFALGSRSMFRSICLGIYKEGIHKRYIQLEKGYLADNMTLLRCHCTGSDCFPGCSYSADAFLGEIMSSSAIFYKK